MPAETVETIKRLRAQGLTLGEIARQMGWVRARVRLALERGS